MNDKIKQMVEDGFSVQKIAHILKIERDQVKQMIEDNQWTLKKEPFNESEIARIKDLYKQGVSSKTLAIKFSIDRRRVRKWLGEEGVLRNWEDSRRTHFFNQHAFDEIDTSEKAYWLGFFYADAYNCQLTSTFSISLQGRDRDHLVKLAKFMEIDPDRIIMGSAYLDGKEFETATLKFYSKYLCTKMAELGCPQKKSLIIKYPEFLSKELHSHFLRGLFDGDGCLTFRKKQKEWKWSLVTTKECGEEIQKILNQNINIDVQMRYISETENNTWELETSGNEKISKILKWLYTDSTENMQLTRKYEKFQQLLEQQANRKIGRENYFLKDNQ